MAHAILCSAKSRVGRETVLPTRTAGEEGTRTRKTVRERIRLYGAAVSALAVCSPMFLAARPKTPLRVFCIAAFEYLARLRDGTLGRQRRVAIALACDFGSLRDAFYDEQNLDVTEYRSLRAALRRVAPEGATIRYMRELRKAERGRPKLAVSMRGVSDSVTKYRVEVIELSLRWLTEIAALPLDRARFHSLLNLICLMQLADDLLDWKDDLSTDCPSYVTALLLERPCMGIATALRAQADELLLRTVTAAREDAGAVLFGFAGRAVWSFVVAVLKVYSPK